MTTMKWMVAWVHLVTGITGHGMCVEDKSEAIEAAAIGNVEYADVYIHWVEPCGEDL